MYRATKDIMLPTTITGSLPRPSWYTENLGTRMFLDAMVSRRYREQYIDALVLLSARAGARRPRHRDRRRLPLRRRRRRPELDQLSAASHGRLRARRPAADAGRARRSLVSARPHPARLSGIAGDAGHHRPGRARRPAIHHIVEDRAAAHQASGEIRRRVGGDRRVRVAGQILQDAARAHARHRRRLQRRIQRARRRRLSGDPDRGAANPSGGRPRHSGQGAHARIDGRGVQPHGERAARQDRSLGAFLLGQSFAAAHVRQGADLQAVARDLQHHRRRRDHFRIRKLRRHRSGSDRQVASPGRRSPSASSTITRCRWKARTRWRRKSAPRSNTSRRSGW